MDLKIILCSLFFTVVLVWGMYVWDSQTTITEEVFKKHTIKLSPRMKRFFVFEHRDRRKYFIKVAVLMDMLTYLFFIASIVYAFIGTYSNLIENLWLGLVGIEGIVIMIFTAFYGLKKEKWKYQHSKNKKKIPGMTPKRRWMR